MASEIGVAAMIASIMLTFYQSPVVLSIALLSRPALPNRCKAVQASPKAVCGWYEFHNKIVRGA